jgi:hypothetical protein
MTLSIMTLSIRHTQYDAQHDSPHHVDTLHKTLNFMTLSIMIRHAAYYADTQHDIHTIVTLLIAK